METNENEFMHDLVLQKITGKMRYEKPSLLDFSALAESQMFIADSPVIERIINELELVDADLTKQKSMAEKHLQLYKLMYSWVKTKQKNISFEEYFIRNGYHIIGIYGMHYVGQSLCEELYATEIKIKYTIDQSNKQWRDIKSFSATDPLETVDAIIVTPITYFDDIKDKLEKTITCPIVSIKTILDEMLTYGDTN